MTQAPRPPRPSWSRLALLLASGPAAAAMAMVLGVGQIAPLAAGVSAWAWMRSERTASTRQLATRLIAWAAVLSLGQILLSALWPERAAAIVPHGSAYWNEMAEFLRTGGGKEGTPALFIPEHLAHLGLFLVLALASGGLLALVLGAYLMGYMSHYVGLVALHADVPLLAGLLAWHPWSVMRVVAFVVFGVVLARPLLERRHPLAVVSAERRSLALAGLLWTADLVTKALIAPGWSGLMRAWGGVSLP